MIDWANALQRSNFHEADLGKCFSDGDTLHLEFLNVALDVWDEYYTARVVLKGVRQIRHFDQVIATFKAEAKNSDVLAFDRSEGHAKLLVYWQWFKPNATIFAKYEFDYETIEISGEKQDELID